MLVGNLSVANLLCDRGILFYQGGFVTKFLFTFIIGILGFYQVHAQHAAGKVYMSYATCESVIDGINVTLDLFQEFDFDAGGATTGKGYYLQTIGSGKEVMKALGTLKIVAKEKTSEFEMFAILSSKSSFAKFELPKNLKESQVEIFAPTFGKVWGKFNCKSSDFFRAE